MQYIQPYIPYNHTYNTYVRFGIAPNPFPLTNSPLPYDVCATPLRVDSDTISRSAKREIGGPELTTPMEEYYEVESD
jgi:hypothetical protein